MTKGIRKTDKQVQKLMETYELYRADGDSHSKALSKAGIGDSSFKGYLKRLTAINTATTSTPITKPVPTEINISLVTFKGTLEEIKSVLHTLDAGTPTYATLSLTARAYGDVPF